MKNEIIYSEPMEKAMEKAQEIHDANEMMVNLDQDRERAKNLLRSEATLTEAEKLKLQEIISACDESMRQVVQSRHRAEVDYSKLMQKHSEYLGILNSFETDKNH